MNHKSVWGSYWKDGKWGYACCHALLKNAYCGGDQALEAEKAEDERLNSLINPAADTPTDSMIDRYVKAAQQGAFMKPKVLADAEKLKESLRIEEKRLTNPVAAKEAKMTPEMLEEYRKRKMLFEDPMANYIEKKSKN
jgi:pre-mRNA-processing factor SLU7